MGKKEIIELLVEGGNAKPGPTIAPKLSQLKLNVGEVIKAINEKTKIFEGMQVPVKIIVDVETKKFEIEVGLPPVSALIKKELKIETAAHNPGKEVVGDIKLEKVIEIAKLKMQDMNTNNLKSAVKMVLGSLVSMGVTVNGKNPKEIIEEINKGKYDDIIK
ncbi:MAG: 50S ribosomal protein L11 [Nanopusillaceae archaeon]